MAQVLCHHASRSHTAPGSLRDDEKVINDQLGEVELRRDMFLRQNQSALTFISIPIMGQQLHLLANLHYIIWGEVVSDKVLSWSTASIYILLELRVVTNLIHC